MHFFKYGDKISKAPKVNARLGLVKYGYGGSAGKHRGDLDSLELSARKACVDLAVYIITGAKTDLRKILAGFGNSDFFA